MALMSNNRIFDIALCIVGFVFIHFPLSQGVNVIHLCVGKTKSSTTCASGEVVLIKEVFRVQVPMSSHEHCGYQNGDYKEHDTGATSTVWKDCNMWPNCNVKFVPSSGKEFLEIHYECLTRTANTTLSICQANLGNNHKYIHSPDYPHLIPTSSVPTRCYCSALLTKLTNITVKVFHTFESGKPPPQTLVIKWDSQAETLFRKVPHFKEFKHTATRKFSLDFSSNIRLSRFWMEYGSDTSIRITCHDKTIIPSTTTTTTSTTTNLTTSTPRTLSNTTIKTTTPITTTTSTAITSVTGPKTGREVGPSSTTNTTSSVTISNGGVLSTGKQDSNVIPIAAGIAVSVVVIVAVVITVVLILKRRRAQGKEPKDGREVGLELQISIDNPVFDPESGESMRRLVDNTCNESRNDELSNGPAPLYSYAGGVQAGATAAEGEVKKGVEASNTTPFKPNVKPKPSELARQEEVKVEVETSDHLTGDVSATGEQAQTKPKPKPKPAVRTKQGPRLDAHSDSENVSNSGIEVYAEVLKTDKGGVGGSAEHPETLGAGQFVNVDGDLYAEVDKNDNLKRSQKGPAVVKNNANISDSLSGDVYAQVQKKSKSTNPVAATVVESSKDSPPGDIYAQVDKTRSKPQVKKRNKGGAQETDTKMAEGTSGDLYAQVQKGNKGKQIPREASKPETVKLDLGVHYNAPSTDVQFGGREVYSSVDDIKSEVPPVGDMENYTDDGLYGSVDDLETDYDHAYAEGRGFSNDADAAYGEIGDSRGGPSATTGDEGHGVDEDDTYDRLQRVKPAQSNEI